MSEPNNSQGEPAKSRWRFLTVLLPWLLAGGAFFNSVYQWIRTDATSAADSRNEAAERKRFEVNADLSIKELRARFDALDRDRETRGVAIATDMKALGSSVATDMKGLGNVLHGRIDDLNRKVDQVREEVKGDVNDLKQRASSLETKLCFVAGVRVAGCR